LRRRKRRPERLAHALASQGVRHSTRTLLPACEQQSGAAGADMQLEQLRQVAPDWHLPLLVALAVADGDHAPGEADVLDPELHQLGRTGAGFQQGLQHQPGPTILSVGLVQETQLLLDRQPVHAAAAFRRGTQAGPLAGGFEHRLALGIVHALADEDGGNGSGGTRDGGHAPRP
jgi:hypothetical protein